VSPYGLVHHSQQRAHVLIQILSATLGLGNAPPTTVRVTVGSMLRSVPRFQGLFAKRHEIVGRLAFSIDNRKKFADDPSVPPKNFCLCNF
jgi:hypothetical protein